MGEGGGVGDRGMRIGGGVNDLDTCTRERLNEFNAAD